ncbi:MAG: cytochrome C biogenesis protein [Candidatus Promineifilaceae bacterium]
MIDQVEFVKLEIFVPETFVIPIRDALSAIGVSRVGNYDNCFSITAVKGYWRPLPGAEPFAGEIGQISEGTECKIEVNCRLVDVRPALKIIHSIHPYDHPLINIVPLLNQLF